MSLLLQKLLMNLHLPDSEWDSLNKVLESLEISGTRYPEAALKAIDKTKRCIGKVEPRRFKAGVPFNMSLYRKP